MVRHRTIGLLAVCSVGVAGCATPATVPKFPVGADERARRELYEQYKLTDDIGVFSATWKRRDGEYNWDALKNVATQYPEALHTYDRANNRFFVLGLVGGFGGGLVGFTAGYNLTAREDKRMSSDTQIALYSVGGGLIVVAIVAGLAWHNPSGEFADAYNRGLRRELGIPETSSPSAVSLWPRSLGRGEYGWQF